MIVEYDGVLVIAAAGGVIRMGEEFVCAEIELNAFRILLHVVFHIQFLDHLILHSLFFFLFDHAMHSGFHLGEGLVALRIFRQGAEEDNLAIVGSEYGGKIAHGICPDTFGKFRVLSYTGYHTVVILIFKDALLRAGGVFVDDLVNVFFFFLFMSLGEFLPGLIGDLFVFKEEDLDGAFSGIYVAFDILFVTCGHF
ncbi:hypothetical protein DSECCO2_610640 [anaerobic digester metagenome]